MTLHEYYGKLREYDQVIDDAEHSLGRSREVLAQLRRERVALIAARPADSR